jgi:hypothetical protein
VAQITRLSCQPASLPACQPASLPACQQNEEHAHIFIEHLAEQGIFRHQQISGQQEPQGYAERWDAASRHHPDQRTQYACRGDRDHTLQRAEQLGGSVWPAAGKQHDAKYDMGDRGRLLQKPQASPKMFLVDLDWIELHRLKRGHLRQEVQQGRPHVPEQDRSMDNPCDCYRPFRT